MRSKKKGRFSAICLESFFLPSFSSFSSFTFFPLPQPFGNLVSGSFALIPFSLLRAVLSILPFTPSGMNG
ncbi:hypothetical protein HOY80DRAFT_436453 [Tuber brumale]|nr:hypothetical protein HOY80DRAFT_436453 [Tuber brumale]